MRALAILVVALTGRPIAAAEPDAAPPLWVVAGDAAEVSAVKELVARRGLPVEVASLVPPAAPVAEAALGQARASYGQMAFAKATAELVTQEQRLIAGRLPSAPVIRALAEVELWLGACLLLGRDHKGAEEHFAAARRLWPAARPDPIFPPEVPKALSRYRAPPAIPVSVRIAPADARLWIDGHLEGEKVSAAPGLHYVVAERVDRRPVARLVRVTRAAPQITLSLDEASTPKEALDALAERTEGLGVEEGLAVSARLRRTLWVVTARPQHFVADRFSAGEPARAHVHSAAAVEAELIETACGVEGGCRAISDVAPPAVARGLPPAQADQSLTAPAPRTPLRRRKWFWGVIGATALAVIAGAVAGGVAATLPRDYVARVH
jgi:hypothetical protein